MENMGEQAVIWGPEKRGRWDGQQPANRLDIYAPNRR
jgi:hypothetical protein